MGGSGKVPPTWQKRTDNIKAPALVNLAQVRIIENMIRHQDLARDPGLHCRAGSSLMVRTCFGLWVNRGIIREQGQSHCKNNQGSSLLNILVMCFGKNGEEPTLRIGLGLI